MIVITQEMYDAAKTEVSRRGNDLNPHFHLDYIEEEMRLIIGFLGEFACQEYLGLNWRTNIRPDYSVADDYDFIYRGSLIEVKTETIPSKSTLDKVVARTINDDRPYGRKLIYEKQFENNIPKCDSIVFGCFLRPNTEDWSPIGEYWYHIGHISCKYILENYKPILKMPYGDKNYPKRCANIRTSELNPLIQE
uniref:hypothetical protein n=1 Tax=Psychrobacter sp. TaxID=56811 RepID=UPI0015990329|nr:hypothetical protein [Psychrobacter sp.]QJS05368.1 hypothetical protein [Psychrobacter sp.]